MTFEEKLLKLRRRDGLSQEDLAEKLGVSRQAVSRWEVGAAKPDAGNLLQISKLFGVTADYLLHDEFESDHDLPAVQNTKSELDAHWRSKALLLTGIVLIGCAVTGLLVLGILGSGFSANISEAVPVPPGSSDADLEIPVQTVRGLFPFLDYHNLSWLFWLCVAVAVIGCFIIAAPHIKAYRGRK